MCASHLSDHIRSREFYKTMSFCNVTRYIMYGVKKEYMDKEKISQIISILSEWIWRFMELVMYFQ